MIRPAKLLLLLVPFLVLLASVGLCQDSDSSASDPLLPGPDEFVPVDIIAEMIRYASPEYPPAAEMNNETGIVWMKVLVGIDGTVKDAFVYKSSGYPSLDTSALETSYKCLFKPAMRDENPVAMWVTYKVNFDLDNRGLPGGSSVSPNRFVKPKEYGCMIDTVLRVLWNKPVVDSPGATLLGTDSPDDTTRAFGILMIRQTQKASHSRKSKQRALALINGGVADGLEVGMEGKIPAMAPDGKTKTVATAVITAVEPFESMCEVEISAGLTLTKYDCLLFRPRILTEAAQLEAGLAAYSSGNFEEALAHLEKIAHRADSNRLIAARLEECRNALWHTPDAVAPEEREELIRRIPSHLAIAREYYRLGDREGAKRYLDVVESIDSANTEAEDLINRLTAFDRCDSIDARRLEFDRSEQANRLPSMKVYVVPESPVEIDTKSVGVGDDFTLTTYHYKGGKVGIDALVGPLGELRQVEVGQTSGDSILDRTAYEAAFNSRFSPAILCGRPEPVWVSWDVVFLVR